MSISLDAEKFLDKIPTPIHHKSFGVIMDTRNIPEYNKGNFDLYFITINFHETWAEEKSHWLIVLATLTSDMCFISCLYMVS